MKTHLIIALVLVSTFTFAQNSEESFKISKNQWIVGGVVSFNSQQFEDDYELYSSNIKRNSFSIKPDLGYVINDNLIIGVMPGFNIYNSKTINPSNSNEFKSLGYSITPYVRKYVSIGKNFAFNLQGEVSYAFLNEDQYADNSSNATKGSEKSFFIGLRPGLTYGLSQKVLINTNIGAIGYSHLKRDYEIGSDSKGNTFNVGLGTSNLYFGVLLIL
ncbi:outer membrane beta-barrel protein [Mariniflexile jejuense]|uniref:Outer membrane beta-barrel protein n=1 Tax=Mariniflexile jejuense TaxID=1173582 RepID=A0ABW3JMQ1_9FLAO